MMSDVPIGAFLSGGYDSSLIAALMQTESSKPIKTFSMGFANRAYNEAPFAKKVSKHLKTDHTELYVTSEDALKVIPNLPYIYDEPFSDSSQIPTFLISKLANQKVKVILSGDGGDELFGGYTRYTHGYGIWQKINKLPLEVRLRLAAFLKLVPGKKIDAIQQFFPSKFKLPRLADRLPKLAEVIQQKEEISFYRSLVSHYKNPQVLVLNSNEPDTRLNSALNLKGLGDFRNKMMLCDMLTYLPDDILTKVDRASMAVSLEARVPLLDHHLVEFAWKVPIEYKIKNGQSKWLLKELLHRYVPEKLMDRPKMGFGVPLGEWLRGPLREWAENFLSEDTLNEGGYFQVSEIRKIWNEHLSEKKDWSSLLWSILMFQAWLEVQRV
jgi:asparagine synthase (glutamine-hydrolysing)